MYLFTRSRRIAPGAITEAMEWVVKATEDVRRITGQQVDAWVAVMSPEVGTVVWTLFTEHLTDVEAAGDKLAADTVFNRMVQDADGYFDGPMSDALATIVHGEVDPDQPSNYVAVVTAVAANGRLTDAVSGGIELAQAATRIGGQDTAFAVGSTGPYGAVMWFTGSPDLATLEASEAAVNADPEFLGMVDRIGTAYAPGAMQTIYRRVV
jgi:hypothetical protein